MRKATSALGALFDLPRFKEIKEMSVKCLKSTLHSCVTSILYDYFAYFLH